VKVSRILLLLMTSVLSACNAAGVQPEPPVSEQAQSAKPVVKPERMVSSHSPQPQSKATDSELVTLTNRLTAVQEQLLQLKAQTAEMHQQNQALLIHIQSVKDQVASISQAQPDATDATSAETTEADFNGVLDQLTLLANELGNKVQDGPFRISSAYTDKGQWVLIRYHRFTGEAWLADKGQWNLLEESGGTGTSEYEVVLLKADKDVKGYVAARIDRINGDTWWLKQDTWQPFVSN
jgi:regulator of replication initiation timing